MRARMIDAGSGPPLVLVPGIQGRWEWMEPTVRALAARFRVLSCSLAGEPGSGVDRREGQSFEVQSGIVSRMLDERGIASALVVGVSFGGLVASHLAATRPERVRALVLASAPGPDWAPDARAQRYMRAPILLSPMFVLGAPWRLGPEILAAASSPSARLAIVRGQLARVSKAPVRPSLMGERLRLMASTTSRAWCGSIQAPTLVLTGEPELDRVVPVAGTRQYAEVIRNATVVTLPRTGHIGCVTKAEEFAVLIWEFWNGLRAQGA